MFCYDKTKSKTAYHIPKQSKIITLLIIKIIIKLEINRLFSITNRLDHCQLIVI